MIKIRNLAYLRSTAPAEAGKEYGGRLYEALHDINSAISNHIQQTNGNPIGEPQPPPSPMGIQVTARDGWMHVAMNDQGPLYRGVQYWVAHADNPQFTNAVHTQASGTELRNHTEFIGNQTRYVQAYKSYPWSGPTEPVIHGGATPIAVVGGGTSPGPLYLPSQGTGTSTAGQITTGPGPVAFRSSTGVPPTR
jgi:hypothetical protein